MSKKIISLILTGSFLAATALSQQRSEAPTPNQDTIKITTTSVLLDVIVTDKTGRRINGLTAADFQVLDEQKPQKIDFFTAIEGARLRDQKPATAEIAATSGQGVKSPLATPFQGRFIAVILDDAQLNSENILFARRSFTDYINTQLGASDLMAVIGTAGSVGTLQQFTNDKQRLIAALNRLKARGKASPDNNSNPFKLTRGEALRIDGGDNYVLADVVLRTITEDPAYAKEDATFSQETANRRQKIAMDEAEERQLKNMIRASSKQILSENVSGVRRSLLTLENLFRGMKDLPGRKIAVLVTESLVTAGATSEDVSSQLLRLIDMARRSGISIYALDAAGLRTDSVTASQRVTGAQMRSDALSPETRVGDFENLGAARVLTLGTGGELIANTNSLGDGLRRAVEDSSSYYVLGFTPLAPPDNKFHRLTVTVKGKADLVVRTRRGYLSVNEETVRGTTTEMVAALISPVPRTDLPLQTVANVVPRAGEQSVTVGLRVGQKSLLLPAETDPDQTATYEVVVWVFASGLNQPVGRVERAVAFDFVKDPQARERLRTEGFLFVPLPMQFDPGTYQVRAVVREKRSGRVGSDYQFFEVPDAKNDRMVSASTLLLSPPGQVGVSAHHAFKPGAEIDIRWIIYNAKNQAQTLAQRVRLIDERGKVLMDNPLAVMAATDPSQAHAPQGTRLKLPRAPGRYSLIISIENDKSGIDIERRADFILE